MLSFLKPLVARRAQPPVVSAPVVSPIEPVEPKENSQNFENLPATSPRPAIPATPVPARKKLLLFLPGVVFVLIVLLLTAKFIAPPVTPIAPPAPTPTPTTNPEPTFNSPWATDSAVIQISSNLNELENQLTHIDLKLIPLLPPPLTLDLEFETEPTPAP